ncbi:DNA-3-methyladenine glycosylase I [Alicyclobacillus hesperidum subsp. aegles]|uniref:DNA-3-methyladenine glycosylase I n=1 Tax=Alicyclobacillus hesperidum TaxID=89784 RepID=UPI00071943E2|nr:DNA-3-methyladenine glycosylase I [Alicyclobacillus hesperidum]KRW90952.1 DNA-3-methyladenine glycosylase [Alicyclobacillus tengchongensis]GLG01657.1 DNA-3-methyladenine glycosylase I [Alicyclobacillus hesperidum subsp. aegles]
MERCGWVHHDPLYVRYHDEEWGVPVYNDRKLFEFLVLESAQAGLSWYTILKKREAYRRAFAGFDPVQVAAFGEEEIAALLSEGSEIVRNRAKVEAAINNAAKFAEIQARCGSFANYLWSFVDGRPIVNAFRDVAEVPAKTPLSERISREWKQAGFQFVGPTIVYSYMQAVGVTMDHVVSCFRYAALAGSSAVR